MIKSFKRLGKAVAPFIGDIGKGLEWFFNNIIKPVTKWTIERALPIFFDLIASTFRIIEPIIKGVGDGFAFIWDHFLGPVLGGSFIAITEFFQVLSNVFKVISENEVVIAILEGLGKAIGVVVGAIAGMIALTTALGAVIIAAKIAFIALTSPITWVIVGITALIAIITLCIKHWDQICKFVGFVVGEIAKFVGHMVSEVGKFFENLWNTIVGIFAGVGKWFTDRFRGAWNGITGAIGGAGKWFGDR